MIDLIESYWLLILLAVLVGFVVAWFLLSGSRKTKVTRDDSEESTGTRRNQALIDSPPAAPKEKPAPSPAPAPVETPRAEPAAAATSIGGAGAAVGAAVAEDIEAAQARPEGADDLTKLKGVGPKLAAQLNELGVTSFAQIADWTDADIDRIDDQLGRFKGRIRRDNWVAQAKLLQSGDTSAYEERFGKL